MEHNINLNIHYTAPKEIWDKIGEVYQSMPYWSGYDDKVNWQGTDIDLWYSVEPGGIQIVGTMPEDMWNDGTAALKADYQKRLDMRLGSQRKDLISNIGNEDIK